MQKKKTTTPETKVETSDIRHREDKARPAPPDYKDPKRAIGRSSASPPVKESSRLRIPRKH
jgi:hypothetical protein